MRELTIRLDLEERGSLLDVIRAHCDRVILALATGQTSGVLRDSAGRRTGEYILTGDH